MINQNFDDEDFDYEEDIDDYINGGLKEISEDDGLDQSIEIDIIAMESSFISVDIKVIFIFYNFFSGRNLKDNLIYAKIINIIIFRYDDLIRLVSS